MMMAMSVFLEVYNLILAGQACVIKGFVSSEKKL